MPPIHGDYALPSRLDGFVEDLVSAHRLGHRFAPTGELPQSEPEAYAVQAAVATALAWRPGAYKASRRPGQAAIQAPIPLSRCYRDGAEVAVPAGAGVELEIGLELLAPLPQAAGAMAQLLRDPEALRALVRPVPVLELIDSRIEGPLAQDPFVKLADGLAGYALVIGTRAARLAADYTQPRGHIAVAGETLHDRLVVPGGDALATLAAFLALQGEMAAFEPGQILITGSLHPAPRPELPTSTAGEIEGIGTVEARLVEARPVQEGAAG